MDVWKGKERPPKAVNTERGQAPISVRVRGEDDNTDNEQMNKFLNKIHPVVTTLVSWSIR